MWWPFRENRESFTDQAIAQAEARAEGSVKSRLQGAIEGCCGLWERGMVSAECERLSPAQMALLGRSLLHTGQVVFVREAGRITSAASTIDVRGKGADPNKWTYRLDLPAPSTTRSVSKSGADVLHVRIGSTTERPWEGCSPLANASATASILAALEQSMDAEAGGPVGNLLPVPSLKRVGRLQADIQKLAGKTVLVESVAAGYGEGAAARPRKDHEPQRLGPSWPDAEIEGRRDVERSVAAACGVPALLIGLDGGAGSDAREAWRQFVFSTLQPVARLLESELERIGLPAKVSFERLAASDLSARSRAFQALTGGGMDAQRAAQIAGFDE